MLGNQQTSNNLSTTPEISLERNILFEFRKKHYTTFQIKTTVLTQTFTWE